MVVVDPRYADSLQWASVDETKVKLDVSKVRTDTTTYAGSAVKYIPLSILEKPETGVCDITATTNGITKTQSITIHKSASNMKDLQVVATSYQKEDPNFDLATYNHMSSDTIYVDMDETITLSGVVEGTLVNAEKEVGAILSSSDIDDLIGASSTDESSNGCFVFGTSECVKLSDTSYQFKIDITGVTATSIEAPIEVNIFTMSGKVSNRKKLVVLAPAQNMTFTMKVKEDNVTIEKLFEIEDTSVGLCLEENASSFSATNFNALHTLKIINEANGQYSVTQNQKNIVGNGRDMTAGDTLDLAVIFRSRFNPSDKKYLAASTDTPLWKSKDETIATVTQDGVVKAVKSGDTEIYCYAAPTKTSPRTDIYAVYRIHVTDLILADNINITKFKDGEQQVIVEDTIYTSQKDIQYAAQLVDGNITANERVTWASTDTSVFTVGETTGIVNPVAAGNAKLIATSVSSGLQAYVPIEVIAAVETVKIVETKTTTNYVQGHTYTLETRVNEGADENEELTWTVENTDDKDPVVVFMDPNDSEKKELTEFVGRTVQIKVKKRGSATVTVKGKYNTSAIDNCTITGISERTAVHTYINYNGADCAGQELTVTKGTNVELKATLLDENKLESTDDFQWNIVQEKEVVRVTNTSLTNEKNLTLQPVTKGDVTVELRNLQTNKFLTVTLHVKVPATGISLEESQMDEVMLVPGEVGTTGVTYQLKPILTPEDTSDEVIYESSDSSIVKVDENGLLTAVKSSETPVTITAKINDTLKATCQVRVAIPIKEMKAEDVEGKTIENNGVIKVYKDETNEIKLNCGDATEYISWTSTNEKFASVKASNDTYSCTINGNVAGTTTLTAVSSVSKKTMQFTVKVVNRITSMALAGSNTVAINATNGYVSTNLPANSDDVIWTVDNPEMVELKAVRTGNVARVNLIPKQVGKVIITATSADGLYMVTKEVEITALQLNSARVDAIEAVVYDGTEKKPKVTVKYGNTELAEGKDYVVTYTNNVKAGTATVTLSEGSSGNYSGTKTVTFRITQRDINNAQIAKISDVTYSGSAIKPVISVSDLGNKLVENTDYTVSLASNTNVGTATITIKGKGNYNGTKSITFKITPKNISKVKVDKITNKVYTGSAVVPALNVTNGKARLSANRDYTVKFSANKNPGKAKAVLKGIGNYTGTKTVYFYITPKNAKINSVTSTSAKSMKIKWTKDTKATGYQIYYATKSSFKGKKTVNITKSKTTSKTIKNLKSGKTYYVKIRSYKKVGSKKVYGAWSNVQSVTIK